MRSRCCLCIPSIVAGQRLGKIPPIVARQRLGRNVAAVTNTHATIEESLDASFSMWPVLYQGEYAFSFSQNFLLRRSNQGGLNGQGHVARIGKVRNAYKILYGIPDWTGSFRTLFLNRWYAYP
jgi:hypothetical protein